MLLCIAWEVQVPAKQDAGEQHGQLAKLSCHCIGDTPKALKYWFLIQRLLLMRRETGPATDLLGASTFFLQSKTVLGAPIDPFLAHCPCAYEPTVLSAT